MTATGHYIDETMIDNWPIAVSASCNFVPGDVNVTTNVVTVTIDVPTASKIVFTSTETLPVPLVDSQTYYAIRVDATHIKVATTPVNAAAGTAVDLTTQGAGTHHVDVGEGSSESQRQSTINRVEDLIERLTQDHYYQKNFTIKLDGNNANELYLGLLPKVLSITSVKVWEVALPTDYYTYDETSIYLAPVYAEGVDPELRLRITGEGRLFPAGRSNIEVTGKYGWLACPAAIKEVAIILCRAENDSTLYHRYSTMSSESLGGEYSYTRGSAYLTGVVEADRLLLPYIRKQARFGII